MPAEASGAEFPAHNPTLVIPPAVSVDSCTVVAHEGTFGRVGLPNVGI
jgi:hypothetical protein